MARRTISLNDPSRFEDPIEILVTANFVAEGAAGPAKERGDLLTAVNHRARVRDETRHIS